jgi:chemotaxis protein histidine kinase CheA
MGAKGNIGLKKYLKALRKGDLELQNERYRGVLESIKITRRALKLQATEYERRLGALNHAHEQAEDAVRRTVSSEKHDDFVEASQLAAKTEHETAERARNSLEDRMNAKIDSGLSHLETKIDSLNISRAGLKGIWVALSVMGGMLLALIPLLIWLAGSKP